MEKCKELIIDNCSIYIDQLKQHNTDAEYFSDDAGEQNGSVIQWTVDEIRQAFKPAVTILNSVQEAAKGVLPDEMELSMQFEIGLKGTTPILKIVSTESSAQLAIKFSWKRNKQ